MDTNVWLDLYKLPPTAIQAVVEAVNNNVHKFWLPNQVYIEFNRHIKKSRDEAIGRYRNIKDNSCNLLNEVKNKINQEFENLKRNNILEAQQAQETFQVMIDEVISTTKKNLLDLDTNYQNEISCIAKDDIIQDLVEDLYVLSASQGFTIRQLMNIYEEGEIRYKYKLPPGYTDAKKETTIVENNFLIPKYGDLVLWKEILKHVTNTEHNVIFIQNEKKSDWWQSYKDKKVAPILLEEYAEATCNKGKLEVMDFVQLLSIYGEQLNLPATTVKDIVAKLKLERAVCSYIETNKNNLIEAYIDKTYPVTDKVYDLVKDVSVFGGTLEEVDNVDMNTINILSSYINYDKEWELAFIAAEVEMTCTADIIEYVNKYVYHSGNISMKIKFSITVDFSIDYSILGAEPMNAYEMTGHEINDEELISISNDEYSIDVDLSDD
jgi:hypothetical protein